jgi:hypothetical protein
MSLTLTDQQLYFPNPDQGALAPVLNPGLTGGASQGATPVQTQPLVFTGQPATQAPQPQQQAPSGQPQQRKPITAPPAPPAAPTQPIGQSGGQPGTMTKPPAGPPGQQGGNASPWAPGAAPTGPRQGQQGGLGGLIGNLISLPFNILNGIATGVGNGINALAGGNMTQTPGQNGAAQPPGGGYQSGYTQGPGLVSKMMGQVGQPSTPMPPPMTGGQGGFVPNPNSYVPGTDSYWGNDGAPQ